MKEKSSIPNQTLNGLVLSFDDLKEMIQELITDRLDPPDFSSSIDSMQDIRNISEDLDVSDLYNMEVSAFDDEGHEISILVENREIQETDKLVSSSRGNLNGIADSIENEITNNWEKAASELWFAVKSTNLSIHDWDSQAWMESAFLYGPGSLSIWAQKIVRNTNTSEELEVLTRNYIDTAKNNHAILNWGVWWSALSKELPYLSDNQACLWFDKLKIWSQDLDWKMFSQQKNQVVTEPASSFYESSCVRLIQNNAWQDILSPRRIFWNQLLHSYPLDIKDANLPESLRNMHREKNQGRLDHFQKTWVGKFERLNWNHYWTEPTPSNRPPLPSTQYINWEAANAWMRTCKEQSVFGWHCIRDVVPLIQDASPEFKAWVEQVHLDATIAKSTENKSNPRVTPRI